MKLLLGLGAIFFAFIGMLSGITDWALTTFFLEEVDWEGPLVQVQIYAWLTSHLGYGLALILTAITAAIGPKA